MSLADVVDLLACPVCATRQVPDVPLRLAAGALTCPQGHTFDVARPGHVNLLGRAVPRNADTAAMVAARERFLATGAYADVAAALVDAAGRATGGSDAVLDVGSGPGWYLDRVLAGLAAAGRQARGLAVDVSPAAARRAARSPWPVGAVVADAWERLPVRTGTVAVALSVFAPRGAAELARVLVAGGVAVVVSPLPEHLGALRAARSLLEIEPGKQERLAETFDVHLAPVEQTDLRYEVSVDADALDDLVGMGPNAFHAAGVRPAVTVTVTVVDVAVRIGVWRRPA